MASSNQTVDGMLLSSNKKQAFSLGGMAMLGNHYKPVLLVAKIGNTRQLHCAQCPLLTEYKLFDEAMYFSNNYSWYLQP